VISLARLDLVADHGERVEHLISGLRTVIDRKVQDGLASSGSLDHTHHVLGRKDHTGGKTETFLLRLFQRHRSLGCLAFGAAVHRIDQVFVDKVLRGEFEIFGVGSFPGRRPQIASGNFAFTAVEFRHLPKFERIALAGAAAKIVKDAAAYASQLGIAAGRPERKIVDGPVRHQRNRRALDGALGERR
jgi:hypothetical protein